MPMLTEDTNNIGRFPVEALKSDTNLSKLDLAEKLAQLSAIVEYSQDSIFSKDLKGKVTSWNPASEKLYGYAKEEIIGKSILLIYPPELKDEFKLIIDRIKKGQSIEHYDTVRIRRDGVRLHVSVSVSPIKDANGKIVGVSHIGRDISERIELERRKDDFISIASHEFKTPLTTLKGFVQILRYTTTNFSADQCRYLDKMNNQIDKLTVLVNDLLDVSKLQLDKLKLSTDPFNMDSLIHEVAEYFKSSDHEIVVYSHTSQKIKADRDRINQVLVNLISNAIKYSPQAKKVVVRSKKEGKFLEVSVQDFGIGIYKKDQERVFERFYQARNKIRGSFAGLGLGLFICSEIIKRHNGQIWVESVKGKGSTFHFRLPLS